MDTIAIGGTDIAFRAIGEGTPILMLHDGYLDHRHMVTGVTVEIARKQTDGRWKYVIDSPDGAALLAH